MVFCLSRMWVLVFSEVMLVLWLNCSVFLMDVFCWVFISVSRVLMWLLEV